MTEPRDHTSNKPKKGGAETVDVFKHRREKLARLREDGWNFPNQFKPTHTCGEIRRDTHPPPDPAIHPNPSNSAERRPPTVSVGGRLIAKRDMGSVIFFQLRDGGDGIQLYVKKKLLKQPTFTEVRGWDLGDIVGAIGTVFWTRTEELSIQCDELFLLCKNLHPLPEKFHGLSDINQRYRRRYLDLIANESVRRTIYSRSQAVTALRDYLHRHDFLEVETPMLQLRPGGANAKPFITHHNALDLNLYLRVSPELYLKRLLVGGFDKVYELNRNFRNEGLSTRHNPEFTMLEFYETFQDYEGMMGHTQEMFKVLARVLRRETLRCGGEDVPIQRDFARKRIEELILDYHPELKVEDLRDLDRMKRYCDRYLKTSVSFDAATLGDDAGAYQMYLYEETIEEKLDQPTFVTHYPASTSPFARVNDDDSFVCDRFELVINGQEIANGFSENNDPDRQREVFMRQLDNHRLAKELSLSLDEDFLTALEVGMPPAAGQGIGIDRLLMQFMGCASIRDVILFPLTRPQSSKS